MFKQLFYLRSKAFFRAPQLATNIIMLLLLGINLLTFSFLFLGLGIGVYFFFKEADLEPFEQINKYLVYYFALDLVVRYLFQKFNPMNIRPLLLTRLTKARIVNHILIRSVVSVFSLVNLLFFIPLIIVLCVNEPHTFSILVWGISMLILVLVNNFINLFLNQKDAVFYPVAGLIVLCGVLQYFNVLDITVYTGAFYNAFYRYPYAVAGLIVLLYFLIKQAQKHYKENLYLDKGLASKSEEVKNVNLIWLDKFGVTGTFLKLDVKMLLRNKRARTALFMSFFFVFYGLLFFTGFGSLGNSPAMQMFAAVFVSGGFVFSYGNYIPSWDSSYYPLMMTQNITYYNYLKAKWWLMIIGTLLSSVLALFYLFFGIHIYVMILAAAVFNIGFNSQLVMLSGAYVKTPIDLTSNKNVMGDKSAYNMKSFLLAIPKMAVPMVLFGIGYAIQGPFLGSALVALAGIAGFAFRNAIFRKIEQVYKIEKYSTLQAYKQK